MKKLVILIIVILLCVAGWAGATYVVGGQVQSQYTHMIDEFGRLGPITMSQQSYQRGFLASTALTVLELELPDATRPGAQAGLDTQKETLQIVFESAIKHGPLLAGAAPGLALIETRLVSVTPSSETVERLLQEFPQLSEPLSVTRIDFSGTMTDRVRIPALETSIDQAQIEWGGLNVDSSYAPGDKTIVGTFDMPRLEIRDADGELTWQGLHGTLDLVEALPLLYVGSTDVSFGNMKMAFASDKDGAQQAMQLKGLKLSSRSDCREKLVNVKQTMEFGGVLVDGETYGPGRCVIDAKNLDGELLGSFQAQVRELYRSGQVSNPDELIGQLLPLYTQLLTGLLEKSPELNISSFSFATPQGNIDGRLLIRYDSGQGVDTRNPQAMLQALDASADLVVHENLVKLLMKQNLKNVLTAAKLNGQIPESFSDADLAELAARQTDAQLETVLAQALVVRDGDMIRSSATFRQGKLEVNGQPLSLFQ